jgi:orotidine 5'-phosphate decarboxylase subfamily 1
MMKGLMYNHLLVVVMRAEEAWGNRWKSCANPLSHRFMEVATKKQSLVILAADLKTTKALIDLIEIVGPYISALKTHVDMIDDFDRESWGNVVKCARKHDLMIFEDRKFADIGKISRDQMGGVYDIRSWADLVTAHRISGPDIVDGIGAGWEDVQRVGGVFLLAQMSSRGNLLTEKYTDVTIETGMGSPHVVGYIGNGSSPERIYLLRKKVGDSHLIWTPGVNLETGDGELGQQYGHPFDAIKNGSDGIIVGSGIHRAEDPVSSAKMYAKESWNALIEREANG